MIFNLFKKRDKDWRFREYCDLEKSLDNINDELTEIALTFNERKNAQGELVKSISDFDLLRTVNQKFENFSRSHVESLVLIKRERDRLMKAMKKLSSQRDFEEGLDQFRLNNIYKSILSKYRSGDIDLYVCDTLLKAKTNEKVRYADNIVFNEKGQILLLKRSELDESKPGYFTIPGGHVDRDEDCETAAKRELEVESGLKVKDVYYVGEYEDEKVHIKYYQSYVDNVEPVLQEEEIWSYEWVYPKDLKNYKLPFNMGENLEKILLPKPQQESILGEYGDEIIETLKRALARDKKYKEKLEKLKKRRDPENIEENKLKSLYDELATELDKIQNVRDSLIMKSVDPSTVDHLTNIIEKAVKDLSKLKKIKKLVNRDGKIFFATYYVKEDELVVEAKKVMDATHLLKNVKEIAQGDNITLENSTKKVTGIVCGMSFNEKQSTHWIALQDSSGVQHYFNSKTLKLIETEKKETEKPKDKFTFVKSLGGSTGAELVEDQYGNSYVKKTGKDKEHLAAEVAALKIYKAFGIRVPEIKEYDEENGVLYTHFVHNLPLNEYLNGETKIDSNEYRGVGVDILLANWDAVGLSRDNMLSDTWGKLTRVDVGGSLDKRAQGEDKIFDETVPEMDSMLDPSINPQYAEVFKDVNLIKALEYVTIHYYDIDKIPEKYKDIIEKRIETIKKRLLAIKAAESLELIDKINYKGKVYNIDSDYYGKDIYEFYERVNKDVVVTVEDLEFIGQYNNSYSDEKTASESLDIYGSEYELIKPELDKMGVTGFERKAINDYTTGQYSEINLALTEYTNSTTGNINIDRDKISYISGDSKSTDFSEKVSSLDIYFNSLLGAAKTVNFHHSQGDKNFNAEKMVDFQEKYTEITGFKMDMITNPDKYSDSEKQSISFLWDKMFTVSSVSKNPHNHQIEKIEKPDFLTQVNYSKSEDEDKIKLRNLMSESVESQTRYNFIRAKLIVNGLRKLEDSNNPRVNIKGTFNRHIDLSGESREKFLKQHLNEGEYVIHQRHGSSAYKKAIFSGSILLKIHGSGVFIKGLSSHPGEDEVLHKPFTLYRNSEVYTPSNSSKTIVVLDKII